MFNISEFLLIIVLIVLLTAIACNTINVHNLIYGILINLVLFTNLLKFLTILPVTSSLIVFFFFFISLDLLIFYIYIYSKFTVNVVKQL